MARVIAADPVQHHRAVVGDAARMVANEQRRAIVRDILDARAGARGSSASRGTPATVPCVRRTRGRSRRPANPARAGRSRHTPSGSRRRSRRARSGCSRQRSPLRTSQRFVHGHEVGGRRRSPVQRHARDGVGESERAACSISRGAESGVSTGATQVANVDRFADQRVAALRRGESGSGACARSPVGRGTALPAAERRMRFDERDGELALLGVAGRSADPVAAIGDRGATRCARRRRRPPRRPGRRGAAVWRWKTWCSARSARRVLAKQSRPDVSLSMRCTM